MPLASFAVMLLSTWLLLTPGCGLRKLQVAGIQQIAKDFAVRVTAAAARLALGNEGNPFLRLTPRQVTEGRNAQPRRR